MPQGFNIGPLTIRFYAIIIIIGCHSWFVVGCKARKRAGRDPEVILTCSRLLIGGIIGARLWHVLTPSASNQAMGITTENYLRNPTRFSRSERRSASWRRDWRGIDPHLYCKARKLNFSVDRLHCPGLLIGQAMAGGETSSTRKFTVDLQPPWAITIDPPYRLPGFEQVARYHPLFLYESLLNFLLRAACVDQSKWRKKLFAAIYSCFILYSITFVSFWSSCAWTFTSQSYQHHQTSMRFCCIIAILLLVLRHTVWAKNTRHRKKF